MNTTLHHSEKEAPVANEKLSYNPKPTRRPYPCIEIFTEVLSVNETTKKTPTLATPTEPNRKMGEKVVAYYLTKTTYELSIAQKEKVLATSLRPLPEFGIFSKTITLADYFSQQKKNTLAHRNLFPENLNRYLSYTNEERFSFEPYFHMTTTKINNSK